ncbi:MAG TPA: site-2 protease family protein [Pyrinomonadaceae bacterium]|nr:site-2 protease family protein [Pyrinomonadaceae bacterium]
MLLTHLFSFVLAMLIHEVGHLVAARLCGVPAPELGLGWGPKLASFRAAGVEFKLHALPIGAYVRLDMAELQRRPLAQQTFVLLAGIFVNLAAAVCAPGTWFSLMNYVLAATNLLPLYQQDGWKCGMVLLRGVMARRSPAVEWTFTVAGGLVSVAAFVSLALRYF